MGLIKLLDVTETAELLKISKKQVRHMIADGSLKATKVGREYRIVYEDILEFLLRERNSSTGR